LRETQQEVTLRNRIDDSLLRKPQFETDLRFSWEQLAIAANFTHADGGPGYLALDPGNTGRNFLTYTPSVTNIARKYEIINISTGTGALTIKAIDGATTIGTLNPGEVGILYYLPNYANWKFVKDIMGDATSVIAESTVSLYTTLALLTNTDVIAQKVPFAFKLISIGVRIRRPATTAAKAATLTAQIAGVACTGGVVSLTSANATPTNTLVAGTAITALNVGTAGQTVEAAVSAVTAFAEGDGYVEFVVQNTD
jgi:hypothetical protein